MAKQKLHHTDQTRNKLVLISKRCLDWIVKRTVANRETSKRSVHAPGTVLFLDRVANYIAM